MRCVRGLVPGLAQPEASIAQALLGEHGSGSAMTRQSETNDFGVLLKRRRLEAGLSQEALAERASISVDAISRNERGLRWAPRRETLALLVDALGLTGEARAEFEGAALHKRALSEAIASAVNNNNFPWQPTSFVGRRHDVSAIASFLAPRTLLTVTGAGGIGKTRTSLEAARNVRAPRDGMWFLDLEPLRDGKLIVGKLASLLDLKVPEGDDMLGAVVHAIAGREMLLMLDNCEHAIDDVRTLATTVLRACPSVTLFATSRERLAISGERVYSLASLALPTQTPSSMDEALAYDAIALFVERATNANGTCAFKDEHLEALTDICRRLDGIALAIELAAARAATLGLQELRAQLAKHHHVIAGGPLDVPARQRTLHHAIAWSHELLSQRDRILFRRLAVFANGWTLEAAQEICNDERLQRAEILDAISSLVAKSMVNVDEVGNSSRYTFFESTRSFAHEMLEASGERTGLSQRYVRWFACFIENAYETYMLGPHSRWKRVIDVELDNALDALQISLGPHGDIVDAARFAGGLQGLWHIAGFAALGRQAVRAALADIDEQAHPRLTSRLLLAQIRFVHDVDLLACLERATTLSSHAGDRLLYTRCAMIQAQLFFNMGRNSEGEQAIASALAVIAEEHLQGSSLHADILAALGGIKKRIGELGAARSAITEALAYAGEMDDGWSLAYYQSLLAEVEYSAGNAERAIGIAKESIENAQRVGLTQIVRSSMCNLAGYQLSVGDLGGAQSNALAALALETRANGMIVQMCLLHVATVAALRGEVSLAARLRGYFDAWCERVGYQLDSCDRRSHDRLVELLASQLSATEAAALAAEGAGFTETAAIAHARTLPFSHR